MRNFRPRPFKLIRRAFASHARSETGLSEFASRPKVELHRHLEGAVRLSTVLDLAKVHGVALPHGEEGTMTVPERLTLEGIRPHIQTLAPFPNLETLLDIFDYTQSTFCDLSAFERIAREAVLDAHAEGIRLLELRYAPSFASLNHNFAYGDVLSAIQEGVRSGQEQLGGG